MIRKSILAIAFAATALAPVAFAAPGDTPGAPAAAAAPAAPAAAAAPTSKPGAVKATKTASPKQQAQRAKMKSCNADAKTKGVKGADRKSFMSTCLKG